MLCHQCQRQFHCSGLRPHRKRSLVAVSHPWCHFWTKQDRCNSDHAEITEGRKHCPALYFTSWNLKALAGQKGWYSFNTILKEYLERLQHFINVNPPPNWYQKPSIKLSIKNLFGKLSSRKPDVLSMYLKVLNLWIFWVQAFWNGQLLSQ